MVNSPSRCVSTVVSIWSWLREVSTNTCLRWNEETQGNKRCKYRVPTFLNYILICILFSESCLRPHSQAGTGIYFFLKYILTLTPKERWCPYVSLWHHKYQTNMIRFFLWKDHTMSRVFLIIIYSKIILQPFEDYKLFY